MYDTKRKEGCFLRKFKIKLDIKWYGYLFIAPFFIVYFIFHFFPIVNTIFLSFTNLWGFNSEYQLVGLKNYFDLLSNELFIKSFYNTLIIWGINYVPQIGLALFLAAVFSSNKSKISGEGFFKILFYLPNIITAASIAILYISLFSSPHGSINLLLLNTGIIDKPFNFFRNVTATRLIVAFIGFWMWYGKTMIILLAGMKGIDPSLFEAAEIDGANSLKKFIYITLPILKPILLFVFVTNFAGGMRMFDIPFLLTDGGPNYAVETVTMFIYKQVFTGSQNYYVASTASVYLLIFISIITICLFKLFNDEKKEDTK